MAQYIDKDALVAKIEKMLQEEYPCDNSEQTIGYHYALYDLQGFLDTLDVKEVDLDWQDIYSILYIERIVMREFGDKEYSNEELCLEVLKRFKAQKGEQYDKQHS